MQNLLLEIGTEEIPAGYIQPALEELSSKLSARLDQAGIEHGAMKTFGTPRRLAVTVDAMADRQKSVSQQITGPPHKIAYDERGRPTTATLRFAEKCGVSVARLQTIETDRGQYLAANKTIRGLATTTLLKSILPEVILAIPFPKTMRWSDMTIDFARPIQTVLALYGPRVVSFALQGKLKSGRMTMGHTFMHPKKIKIRHADEYGDQLLRAGVVVDIQVRKKMVDQETRKAAALVGARVLPDDELMEIVTNLVEMPFATVGKFDTEFLELPREILITAMREHQKYFALVDAEDRLTSNFIAVNNTRTKDMRLVATGHERVLRARLADAKFFYESDRRISMERWVEKLKGVLFQAQLGSMHAKTERVVRLAAFLARQAFPSLESPVCRAALLSKADLVSQVVVEFPKLQGVMGRVYATAAGESADVAMAIEEHYRPRRSGGVLPATDSGSVLAMADKIDSICGCFAVGLNPTGASDPYALRRQGIGVIRIMLAKKIDIPLRDMIAASLDLFALDNPPKQESVATAVVTFFHRRMANLLVEKGCPKDLITAVLIDTSDSIPDTWERVQALMDFRGQPDFEPLIAVFKRIANILKKVPRDILTPGVDIDSDLFREASEARLFAAYRESAEKINVLVANKAFAEALAVAASLRGQVDTFFEDVLVMAKEPQVRRNRLALLGAILALLNGLVDFSKINP